MLAYAYQILRQQSYKKIEAERFDNIHDLFAAILAQSIAVQLKRGLNREYIAETEQVGTLHGRVDFTTSIKQQTMLNKTLICTYDSFSENFYMNRILKTTALLLLFSPDVKDENKASLRRILLFFSDIEELDPKSINWSTLRYHKDNATYQMLMNVCYLVIHGLLLSTESGERKLATFLDDQHMSRLYEKFILEYYKKHYPQLNPAARQIDWAVEGGTDFLPAMRTDTVLTNGDKALIIDAKYYGKTMQTRYGVTTYHSYNVYQIMAYVQNKDVTNTGKIGGMLLYAKTDEVIVPNGQKIIKGNPYYFQTLDLYTTFENIARQLNNITKEYFLIE
jgi:McrBC 5-methylcytosine restriction system component